MRMQREGSCLGLEGTCVSAEALREALCALPLAQNKIDGLLNRLL
jgi:hypothetical protein